MVLQRARVNEVPSIAKEPDCGQRQCAARTRYLDDPQLSIGRVDLAQVRDSRARTVEVDATSSDARPSPSGNNPN
jgi:hypothetical protein